MKRHGLTVGVILLAFGLRIIWLQGRALWYDEAFAILYGSLSPERIVYGTVTPVSGAGAADVHPLLYYFLLHGWMGLAGHSPLAARFLSVLLGTVTVALLARLAAWCFDRRTGLVVGLLAAVNPFHVAYSQEARMYALLGLAAVLAAWGLLRALGDTGTRRHGDTETGRRGDTETGRRGDTETRRRGDTETRRRGDTETRRRGDTETRRREDTETRRREDTETRRRGDTETRRRGDTETRRREDTETRRRGDTETRRRGDTETRRRGDTETRRHGDGGARNTEHGTRNTQHATRTPPLFIGHWSLVIVSAALTLYAHNLGAFVLLALHLLAVSRRRWWRKLPALLLADLAVLALFGPWLVAVLPGQIGFVGRSYWVTPPGPAELARAVMQPLLTFYEPAPAWVLALGLFGGLLLLALLALRAGRTRSRAGWFLLLWAAPILALLLLSLWRPLYLERALLPSALFYLVAVGWLLARGGLPRPLRLGLSALLAVTIAGSLLTHYTYARFPRPPFDEAAATLRERVAPGDAVVHTNKLTYFPMRVYAPDLPAAFLADPPGAPQDTLAYPTQEALGIFASATITEAVGTAERVWLVYFPQEIAELGGEHPALTWLADGFVEAERTAFNDLTIVRYERTDDE